MGDFAGARKLLEIAVRGTLACDAKCMAGNALMALAEVDTRVG